MIPIQTERRPRAIVDEADALRVALVADTLAGWSGGAVVSGRRFVDKLRERHRVVVIGAALPDADPDRVKLPGFQLPLRSMRDANFVMAIPDRERLRDAIAGVDLVHLHFPFWVSYAALEEARRLHRPVVASFHVQPENLLLNVGLRSRALARAMYRIWVDGLYNRADSVICPSRFAERKLRTLGLRARTHVISNGTPPDFSEHPVLRKPSAEGTVLVLSVGRLAAEKRHDVLIDAVDRSRHRSRIQLVIAGPGHMDPELRRRAEALPKPAEIGFVERSRFQQLLETAHLYVHPSDVELEGMAVVEAMTVGLPVIVSDSSESAAAEFALEPRFRFRSGDADDLAARIDAMLDRPAALEDVGRRYADFARTLDFGHSVEHLVEVYRSLLTQR